MRKINFDNEIGTVIMLIVFILTIFLLPNVAISQSGDLWFGWPGSIEVKQDSDSTFWIAADEMPTRTADLYDCRFEWWVQTDSGRIGGILTYVGCLSKEPIRFAWPVESDNIFVRKWVHWETQAGHGQRWAGTQRKQLSR